MSIEIRLAELSDIAQLVDHDLRHLSEPGFEGTLAHPFPLHHPWNRDKMMNDKLESWPRDLTEEHWARSFLLIENGAIKGHLNLKNLFMSTLHRAQLGMGLEQDVRGKGYGSKLLATAINWANEQQSLEWIDLSVFSHNRPARKMYANAGFEELFTFPDRLRVGEVSIDDVYMTLKLREQRV